MMSVVLRDKKDIWGNLLPLTFTRPIAEIRVGIFTIAQKWQRLLAANVSFLTEPFLQPLYTTPTVDNDTLIISSNLLPTRHLADTLLTLNPGDALCFPSGEEIARRGNIDKNPDNITIYSEPLETIDHLYDIFLHNGKEIEADTHLLTSDEFFHPSRLPESFFFENKIIGSINNLFVHPTATIQGAIVNLTHGPVYIGPEAIVMEGATIRGPLAVCRHSEIKMGAKIYENTTIGPDCKVGGEIANVVFIGHSNKAHDGFLGNSVIGQWCNLGAGTVASNLKNDYSEIKLWNYPSRRFLRTGLQFCGLFMGDHSKTGINTMINTATVFGVGVNFHGAGYPRNFVPSFTEGSVAGLHEVPVNKFLDIAARVLARRDLKLSDTEINFFRNLHSLTETYR